MYIFNVATFLKTGVYIHNYITYKALKKITRNKNHITR